VAHLAVHLLDGFAEDVVVVEVDGHPIARRDQVTTQLLLGLATTLEVDVRDGPASVTISVPTRNLAAEVKLDPRTEKHLLVGIESGSLTLRATTEAPGFL
jgi:hypothetical protein